MKWEEKKCVNHAATSLSLHSFEPVCMAVLPKEKKTHQCKRVCVPAFNALMANNYVLTHSHFFVLSLFDSLFISIRSSFVCNESMGEQTYIYVMSVFSLWLDVNAHDQ